MHGGRTPLAIEAARRRIWGMVDYALDALFSAMQIGKCDKCGRSEDMGVVVRAAQIVLDRTGFHPTVAVEQKSKDTPAWTRYLTDSQMEQIVVWMNEAKRRIVMGEEPPKALPPVVEDGVLLEDEDVDGPPRPVPN
jgi:hypothetical protein